jgi:Rrf2 family protein
LLKLTKKADYGLIALRHLASLNAGPEGSASVAAGAAVIGATASAKDIADAYHLPLPLMAKVLQKLARARILKSVSGTNGGYGLARDPRHISALEVIRAIDGPVILTHCFTEHGTCDQSDSCTVREPLRRVHEAILELLNGFTITDLAEPAPVKLTPLTLTPSAVPAHQVMRPNHETTHLSR